MRVDEASEWKGGKDVAVMDQQGLVSDPRSDVFQASTGLKEDGLVKEIDRELRAGNPGMRVLPSFGQMMGIDREAGNPSGPAGLNGPGGQGAMKQGDQGFRQTISQWTESGAESGTEDEGLIHVPDLPEAVGSWQAPAGNGG